MGIISSWVKDGKVNAPINIYLNDGTGRYKEDINLYQSGDSTHPFAYRLVAKDFNNDGVDDLFAGSMGVQVRYEDYSQNHIDPYPHLLLLSDNNGKLVESSSNITDDNNGKGILCSFAHDASAGDPDGDGDIDIYACNVLLINDEMEILKSILTLILTGLLVIKIWQSDEQSCS